MTLPGATILIENTAQGFTSDFDGNFSINASIGAALIISYVGYSDQKLTVGASDSYNISLESDNKLDEVVVTALGIQRSKKSLGSATQKVDSKEISTTKSDNIINQLSGKVAGLAIQRTNNIGGSTNVVIRGHTSLTGSNQALFVLDGVLLSNLNTNARTQSQGSNGYDYGNPVSDINPEDIESISVLKGAAATALYGSRESNGVIMVTKKKGIINGNKNFSVEISSNITIGSVDKSTFPEFQNEYGASYGGEDFSFTEFDINNDGAFDKVVNVNHDASFGPKFDPNLNITLVRFVSSAC